MKFKKVCSKCGGENIHVNAWIQWSVEKQDYEIEDFWGDESWCDDCEETVGAENKEAE